MIYIARLSIICALLAINSLATLSQTPRRRTRPATPRPTKPVAPQPTPEPVSRPAPPRTPKSPVPLAIVNGQTVTTADIDPAVREQVEIIEERIAEVPRQIVELQINTELLQLEARKRKLTDQKLYDLEVTRRVTDPSEAEIKQFIAANRDELDESDPNSLRQEVISLFRANREAALSEEFVRRLRSTNPVVMVADVSGGNLSPAMVVATVGGRPVTAEVIIERLKPVVYKLRLDAYELQRGALERTVNDLLLIAEANKRNVGPEEIVRTEISDKARTPTEADVVKFYSENKARINGDLDSVRNQVAAYLLEQDRQRLEQALSERLLKSADVRWLIPEPQPPRQSISVDDDPSRGEINAPVTVVEFTDFQCSACAAMHPILEEVIKSYGNKVRFVVRDFPLNHHAQARKAAEAANAAHAQGKFFEYAALLFKRQNALDVPSLKKYAAELGLDRSRFDAALDSGAYASEVKHDIEQGEIYGIDSTPTIFVNGVMLRKLSAEGLRAAIDEALASSSSQTKPPH